MESDNCSRQRALSENSHNEDRLNRLNANSAQRGKRLAKNVARRMLGNREREHTYTRTHSRRTHARTHAGARARDEISPDSTRATLVFLRMLISTLSGKLEKHFPSVSPERESRTVLRFWKEKKKEEGKGR